MATQTQRHTISVLVENRPGVLSRITGLFARRAFNINSLTVSPTERPDISRITVTADVESEPLEQIIKQLNKLLHVLKIVELDDVCRMQQVHDGCFPSFDDVPKKAMTVTIPKLVSARKIFCIVPTDKKAEAVRNALTGPVATSCPASILRTVPGVSMYIDAAAASLL